MPGKPPSTVTRGPWRSAEPAPGPVGRGDRSVLSTVLKTLFNIDTVFDLAGWLFVIVRFIGHAILIALHAIFHV